MSGTNAEESSQVEALRELMISKLRELGAIRSDRVADVFRTMPRHLFTPGTPLEEVYAATAAVYVKWDEHGVPISTVTAPELQAFMLEQADLQPGMNTLEIGPVASTPR
jgi:protein-L-isoaspartate(D-aspartate) O-methyltransferase